MNNRKFFSLIELLVSISIIAILAGMVIGGLGAISEKSNMSDTKSTIMSLESAILKYYENQGVFPGSSGSLGSAEDWESGSHTDVFSSDEQEAIRSYGFGNYYDAWEQSMIIIFPENYDSTGITNAGEYNETISNAYEFKIGNADVYYNLKTFQIISPGADGRFGNDSNATQRGYMQDNVYNFTNAN